MHDFQSDWKTTREHFPVKEKSGNFDHTGKVREIYQKFWKSQEIFILESWKKYWKIQGNS